MQNKYLPFLTEEDVRVIEAIEDLVFEEDDPEEDVSNVLDIYQTNLNFEE